MSVITTRQLGIAYATGGAALLSSLASTTFSVLFAVSDTRVSGIELLGFVSAGVNVLSASSLGFFVCYYIPKINKSPAVWTPGFSWRVLAVGISVAGIALATSVATLIWTSVHLNDLPEKMLSQATSSMLTGWWMLWSASLMFDAIIFSVLGWWIARSLRNNSIDQSSLDFGIPQVPPMEERPTTSNTARSFRSQDPTIAVTPPRTPPAPNARSSTRSPYSGKVRSSSSKAKLIRQNSTPRESTESSFDAGSIDDGFDRWDTSGVGKEIRKTLQPSPSAGALETIPGSRPESPAKALDGPFLPESPHASTTDATFMMENYIYSSSRPTTAGNNFSSPPSSPPNFSRPTSRQFTFGQHNPPALAAPPPTPPMEELIHPLFRSDSPNPPQIASSSTSIHASPEAGQTISQHTLTRMRSGSLPRQGSPQPEGHGSLTRMRSGSFPRQVSPLVESESIYEQGAGSPGPSIVEEEDLPPVIPGFVLSAGSRTSLVGYGKRKSVKGRDESPEDPRRS